jgi:hypothetical protein
MAASPCGTRFAPGRRSLTRRLTALKIAIWLHSAEEHQHIFAQTVAIWRDSLQPSLELFPRPRPPPPLPDDIGAATMGSMALIVFFRGIDVGRHRTFRPSVLAKELGAYDAVNVGATGTLSMI